MYEFLLFIKDDLHIFNPSTKLTMYDVAGAPGMFILSTEQFLKKYFPNTTLDWHSCSLEGGTALTDTYGLFAANPSRYQQCDVLKPSDIQSIINTKQKYELVTGDIGI